MKNIENCLTCTEDSTKHNFVPYLSKFNDVVEQLSFIQIILDIEIDLGKGIYKKKKKTSCEHLK